MSAPFDIGPLTWVKSEVDSSLERAQAALRAFGGDTRLGAELKSCGACLHQAAGAVQIVGLEGASRFFEETEHLVSDLESGRLEPSPAALGALERAIAAIGRYLSELLGGASDEPLRLLPEYRALAHARGTREPAASELFFPDLSLPPPPRIKPAPRLPRERLESCLSIQRARFQRALVKWLREPADVGALEDLRAAADAVEQTQSVAAQRAFWWAAGAFFDALALGDLGPVPEVRQLSTRIEQQLRRLAEGSPSVAERLHREVLYWLAQAGAASARARAVKQAFALDGALREGEGVADLSQRLVIARGLREVIAAAKEAWGKFAAGADSALSTFARHAHAISARAPRLASAEFGALAEQLERVALELQAHPGKPSAALAMEVATALLVIEAATANHRQLPQLAGQLATMRTRVELVLCGARGSEPLPEEPLLQEMTRLAQEKLALDGALTAMQANLLRVEKVLDDWCRDPAAGIEFARLEALLHQISGALGMLSEEDARAALERAAAKIRSWNRAAGPAPLAQIDEVAEILAGLGFYIEALRHGKADFAAIMRPLGAARAAPSVEGELARTKQAAQAALQAWQHEPRDPQLTARLKGSLKAIRADSELLAEHSLGEQAQRALVQLDATGSPELARQLGDALAGLAASARPSAQAQELSQSSDQTIDRELVAIFLEEADGVLARIGESRARCGAEPGSIAHLAAIRRGFHTLKGSGRMVGLNRFGEAAWAIEQVLNLWLEDERGATPELLALVDCARSSFEDWVRRLRAGKPQPDAAPLIAAAESITREPSRAEAEEALVAVGAARVSPSLYAAFVDEAPRLIAALEAGLATPNASGAPDEALLRAAHTLAGICGTLKLDPMQALGQAVEGALLRLRDTALHGSALACLGKAVAALGVMYGEVLERRAPAPRAELAAALDSLAAERTAAAHPEQTRSGSAQAPAREHPQDEIEAKLLPAFLEEALELAPRAAELLASWRVQASELEHGKALQRVLHTLKGGARMAGVTSLGELVHAMETRVEDALAQERIPEQLFTELEQSCDRVASVLEHLQEARAPRAAPRAARPQALQAGMRSRALLRVQADVLEKLVNEAGEVAIARSRTEGELRNLGQALSELTGNVARLRNQLREIEIQAEARLHAGAAHERAREFDALEFDRFTRFQELTRLMAEGVNDVATVQHNLARTLAGAETALAAQDRLTRELQQDLVRIRMVPVATLAERLQRLVRQVSKELGKRAHLDLRGAGVELDRALLQRLTGPLEHLLRNALTHGIELPAERAARGKPETGEIRLEVRQEGNEIALELSDDGQGLDLERIRATALAQGRLRAGEQPSERQLAELIFEPGFSTAERVSEIAGRGVGLDVVKNEVGGLGGRIELDLAPRQGARFVVRLPLTTAVTQAVLVKAGARISALPAVMIEQVQRPRAEQLSALRAAGCVEWDGRRYPLAYLPSLLGEDGEPAQDARASPVLLLRAGVDSVALLVDEMLGNQEVVVKNLGPQLERVPGLAGVTVLAGGEIVLILNPVALARRPPPMRRESAPAPPAVRPRVMVVDDSLTMRKVTGRLLAREGYQVLTAKDGVEALEQLAATLPDVLLVDIEMPRMDGFDLARNVRADARLQRLPIIMVTSRSADKHRRHALELGVDAFLGKPYREEELLGRVAGLVQR